MSIGFLVDAVTRKIDVLALSHRSWRADVTTALGGHGIELGAELADGTTIYLDRFALMTSDHFFRHCLAPTALSGRGVIIGNPLLTTHQLHSSIAFMSRDEAFQGMRQAPAQKPRPYDTWLQDVTRGRPGVSLVCRETSWRLQCRES